MKRKCFPKHQGQRSKQVLELIHSDVVGKIVPSSLGGAQYFVTFIDNYSNYTVVRMMKHKSETLQEFISFQKRVENMHNSSIKQFQSDNGGEYSSMNFKKHLEEKGILHRRTVPYTPQQNGKAERLNLTLMDMVRCMLTESGLPHTFWAEALNTACYIRNRCLSKSINNEIPYERWSGRKLSKADLEIMKVFGCCVWATTVNKKKLDARAEKCVMLGYEEGVKGYRLWHIKSRKIIISRDVVFQEDVFPFKENQEEDEKQAKFEEFKVCFEEENNAINEDVANEHIGSNNESEVEENEDYIEEVSSAGEEIVNETLRRSNRLRKIPTCSCCNLVQEQLAQVEEPNTVEEALSGKDAKMWEKAMNEELNNMKENEAWEIVERPKKTNVIGSKWVFKIKRDNAGEIVEYKARLVAQGYKQIPGVDCADTFSPVICRNTLKILLAVAVERSWMCIHLDVDSAYLNSGTEETVYMEQPKFFEEKQPESYVCKLNKSIYGLKQSGRNWNNYINKIILQFGLVRSRSDGCVYYSENKELIIGLYVDDIVLIGRERNIQKIKVKLQDKLKIKYLGEVSQLLSIRVRREDSKMELDQTKYINSVLDEFNMKECNGLSTPLEVLDITENDEKFDEKIYRKAVGSLLYIANGTRPDISFAVAYLSQFNNNVTKKHWTEVKHLFRYLKKTAEMKLTFRKEDKPIQIYTDADWANNKSDRKSWSGFVIVFAGAAVVWKTRKQRTVALSTVEAEYIAMTEVVKEWIWIKNFFEELGLTEYVPQPCVIKCDNQGAISLSRNNVVSAKSKHIDIRLHYLRDYVDDGSVRFEYVNSRENIADMFTKALPGARVKDLCCKVGLC